jgi:hypothetical protein
MAHIEHYRRKPAWDQGIADCGSTVFDPEAQTRRELRRSPTEMRSIQEPQRVSLHSLCPKAFNRKPEGLRVPLPIADL